MGFEASGRLKTQTRMTVSVGNHRELALWGPMHKPAAEAQDCSGLLRIAQIHAATVQFWGVVDTLRNLAVHHFYWPHFRRTHRRVRCAMALRGGLVGLPVQLVARRWQGCGCLHKIVHRKLSPENAAGELFSRGTMREVSWCSGIVSLPKSITL